MMRRLFILIGFMASIIPARAAGPYLLCIGDSITEGFGSSPATDPCTITAANLSAFTGTTYTEINHGEIGTTSAQWVPGAPYYNYSNAVNDINTYGASNIPYALITLGTNDAQTANRQTAATYAANIEALVAGLVSNGIAKVIINQPPWLGANTGIWDASSLAYIEGELAEFPAIQAANPTNTFLGNQTFFYLTQANPNLYMNENDLVHPAGVDQDNVANNPGYVELGYLWANAIEGLFFLETGPWAGALDPWRATDWTKAGIQGYSPNDPPSDSWTQCGTTIAAYGSSGSPQSCSTILNAFSGCAANTYVLLAGTAASPADFYLSGGCDIQGYNNVELRGGGPRGTRIHFYGSSGCGHGLGSGGICLDATDSTYGSGNPTGVNWTAGYNKGANQITVASGSNITANATVLVGDQDDDGYLGYPGSISGSAIDTSGYYNCQAAFNPTAVSVGTVTVANGTQVTGTGFSASYGGEILLTISGVVTSVPFIYISSTTGALGFSVANGSYAATFPVGCSFNASVNAGRTNRGQQEYFQVTACSPACGTNSSTVLTIDPPLIHPNWSATRDPQVFPIQPSQHVGIRGLLIDGTNSTYSAMTWCSEFYNTANSWVFNVAIENCPNTSLYGFQIFRNDWHSDYIFNAGQSNPSTDNSAINWFGGSNFIVNNICHNCHLAVILNGPGAGNFIGYNYVVNSFTGNSILFNAIFDGHGNGDDYNLWESNVAPSMTEDQPHGTHLMETWNRNFLPAWESCASGLNCGTDTAKTDLLSGVLDLSFNRYTNFHNNVLGSTAVTQNGYQFEGATTYYTSVGVVYPWNLGSGNSATVGQGYAGGPIPFDPNVLSTISRVGNWDAYNLAAQWNSSEAGNATPVLPAFQPDTVCTSSLPCAPSYVFSARPSTWYSSSIPFPAIGGGDVTGGNVGVCTGTPNTPGEYAGLPATSSTQCVGTGMTTGWGGHVNAIPAQACYLALGGLLDGTGGALSYDASCTAPIGNLINSNWKGTFSGSALN